MRSATSLLKALLASVLVLWLLAAGCGGGNGSGGIVTGIGTLNHIDAGLQPGGNPARDMALDEAVDVVYQQDQPGGVDPAVFADLQDRLVEELQATGAERFTSEVPSQASGQVTDLTLEHGAVLRWSYRNVGDYNQNGLVDVGDLTRIGQRFLEHSPSGAGGSFPFNSSDSVVDGNGDGLIGQGDITPIAVNWLSNVKGYVVEGAAGVEGPWTPLGQVALPVPRPGYRITCEYELGSQQYDFYFVTPVDLAGNKGTRSVQARENNLVLDGFSQEAGRPGEPVQLSGTGFSAEASDLELDWGVARSPLATINSGSAAFFVPPLEPGEYQVRLVSDQAASNFATFEILPVASLPYTETGFASLLNGGISQLAHMTSELVVEASQTQQVELDSQQVEYLTGLLDQTDELMDEIEQGFSELNPSDAQKYQSVFYESGLLRQLEAFNQRTVSSAKESSAVNPLHYVLYQLDALSSIITNISPILDVVNVLSIVGTAATGGGAAPIAALPFSVSVSLLIIDGVIDGVIPTDLKRIELPPIDSVTVGSSTQFPVTGYFQQQDDLGGKTLEVAVKGIVGGIGHGLLDSFEVDKVVAAVLEYLLNVGFESGLDIFDGVNRLSPISRDPIPVELDMSLYGQTLPDTLETLFPDVDLSPILDVLASIGIDLEAMDPVQISDSQVLDYSHLTGQIYGLSEGTAQVRCFAHTFVDQQTVVNLAGYNVVLMTYSIPVEVNSGLRSITVVGDMPAPVLTASKGTYDDKIEISWDSIAGAANYVLYGSVNQSGPFAPIVTQLATTFLDYVPDTAHYWYKVEAKSSLQTSPFSNIDFGYRRAPTGSVPPVPEDLHASQGTYSGYVLLSWSPSDGATSYLIFRSETQGGSYSHVDTTTTVSYEDDPGDTNERWYKVKAHNTYGDSDFAGPVMGFKGQPPPEVLSPPQSLLATDGTTNGYVHLSWLHPSAGPSPDGYKIFRATSADGEFSLRATVGHVTQWDDNEADAGTVYRYKAKSYRSNYDDSDFSNRNSGYWEAEPPNPPEDLAASDGTFSDKVRVTWSHPSQGSTPDGYKIYRATSQNGSYTKKATVGYTTQWDDTSATPLTTYWYKALSYKSGYDDSNYCTPDDGYRAQETLNPPQSLSASDGTFTNKVRITWSHPSSGPTPDGYKVYRDGSYLGTASYPSTQYDDASATPGASYSYTAKSYKSGYTDSGYSNSNSGWRKLLPPDNVDASDGTYSDKVRITWSTVSGATSYKIYRDTASGGSYPYLGSTSNTLYDDTSATPNQTYYYKVCASCSLGNSDKSGYDGGWRSSPLGPDDYEDDDSRGQAKYFDIKKAVTNQERTIYGAADHDWLKFDANKGSTIHFYTTGSTDTRAQITLSNGDVLAWDDDSGTGNNFSIVFDVPYCDVDYYLEIWDYYDDETGEYDLHFYRESDIFHDDVSADSLSYWSSYSEGGQGYWHIENSNYWRMSMPSQNEYDNDEYDLLTSKTLYVPPNTGSLELSFDTRYQIESGFDYCYIEVDPGTGSYGLEGYLNGNYYPGWQHKSYSIPANTSSSGKYYHIRFKFDSDGSVTDWGVQLDDIQITEN